MFFILVFIYFLAVCFVTWLVLFSSGHTFAMAVQRFVLQGLAKVGSLLKIKTQKSSVAAKQHSLTLFERFTAFAKRNHLLILVCMAVMALPPLFIMAFSYRDFLGSFYGTDYEANVQVAGVLMGEQLAPPEPLPPAVFSTKAVSLERPMLYSASRKWQLLKPEFRQKLLTVFNTMKTQYGYQMVLIEGYRSPERQNMLAKLGGHITNAKAFQSYHQYGLAADCAFYRDGKLIISEKDPWAMEGYRLYGAVAESVGLTWGGQWKMMDFGHTELRIAKE